MFLLGHRKNIHEGKIGNFNSTLVELTKNGNTVTVPRESISKEFKIREGHYAKGYLRYKDIKLKNSK